MIAEIKNKAPRDYIGKEDVLTGNFFGALRYTKFQDFLGKCLLSIASFRHSLDSEKFKKLICRIDNVDFSKNIKFWPNYSDGEIDLLLEFNDTVIGIEVKLHSGLSSDDEIDNSSNKEENDSINQLNRYANLLKNNFTDKNKVLLFLAKEPDVFYTFNDVVKRNLITKEVLFGYFSWDKVYNYFSKIDINKLEFPETILLNDLHKYLDIFGFSTFKDWSEYLSVEQYESIPLIRNIKWSQYKDTTPSYKMQFKGKVKWSKYKPVKNLTI